MGRFSSRSLHPSAPCRRTIRLLRNLRRLQHLARPAADVDTGPHRRQPDQQPPTEPAPGLPELRFAVAHLQEPQPRQRPRLPPAALCRRQVVLAVLQVSRPDPHPVGRQRVRPTRKRIELSWPWPAPPSSTTLCVGRQFNPDRGLDTHLVARAGPSTPRQLRLAGPGGIAPGIGGGGGIQRVASDSDRTPGGSTGVLSASWACSATGATHSWLSLTIPPE